MTTPDSVARLEERAYALRRRLLSLTGKIGGAHLGGALSALDMLTALYFRVLRVDPAKPRDPDRDVFILSKGHSGIAHCVTLAARGFFPDEELDTFNQTGSKFAIHPDRKVPGVEAATGSLGHGLGMAVGFALAKRRLGRARSVWCMLGDGELCEGSVWEAFMAGAHFRLGRLAAVVDANGFSQDGPLEGVMGVEPLKAKLAAFGWDVRELDGNDMGAVVSAFEGWTPVDDGRPVAFLARTVKGKGVPWMEGAAEWHYGGLDEEKERLALADLAKACGREP